MKNIMRTVNLLSAEQREFYDFVMESIREEKTGLVLLMAPAGTGKTFTVKTIIDDLEGRDFFLAAPTHKAVAVLREGMNLSPDKYGTLHSFLRLEAQYTPTGRLFFEQPAGAPRPFEKYDVVFIDETSMVNSAMFHRLKEAAQQTLVVLTGDMYQIPPIGETVSEVFTYSGYLAEFTLKENKRTDSDYIGKCLVSFRDAVDSGKVVRVDSNPISSFEDSFFTRDSIILTFTNRAKDRYNNLMHKTKYAHLNTPRLEKLYPGERIVVNSCRRSIAANDGMLLGNVVSGVSDEDGYFPYVSGLLNMLHRLISKAEPLSRPNRDYHSCDELTVQKVKEFTFSLPYFTCAHIDSPKGCGECKLPVKRKTEETVTMYLLTDNYGLVWGFNQTVDGQQSVKEVMDYLKLYCIEQCRRVKASRKLLPPHVSKGDVYNAYWGYYYELYNILNNGIDLGYALTTHKSQGSQWENVYVNLTNIRRCPDKDTSRRLAYTAVSRARKTLEFIR